MSGLLSSRPALALLLNDNGAYQETLSIGPIDRPAGCLELLIRSTLSNARDPAGTQVRYRTTLSIAAIADLQRVLGEALALSQDTLPSSTVSGTSADGSADTSADTSAGTSPATSSITHQHGGQHD